MDKDTIFNQIFLKDDGQKLNNSLRLNYLRQELPSTQSKYPTTTTTFTTPVKSSPSDAPLYLCPSPTMTHYHGWLLTDDLATRDEDMPRVHPDSSPSLLPMSHNKRELEENPEHNLKSTSLIMRHLLRSANQFDEAMKGLESLPPQHNQPDEQQETWSRNSSQVVVQKSHQDLFSRSSQLITNMNAITKSNSGNSNSWWKAETSPSPTRRYSSSVDGDKEEYHRFESSSSARQRRFSHENTNTTTEGNASITSSNLKHVNHLNILLEETKRLSDQVDGQLTSMLTPSTSTAIATSLAEVVGGRKPIAAPRIKKLGSSSVMSQLTQLRRMYEAADEPESDTSTKADQEVCSYLGDRDVELFSGSWSKIKAKRNSAILSDIRKSNNDHDLYLGIPRDHGIRGVILQLMLFLTKLCKICTY